MRKKVVKSKSVSLDEFYKAQNETSDRWGEQNRRIKAVNTRVNEIDENLLATQKVVIVNVVLTVAIIGLIAWATIKVMKEYNSI